ncbi:hypothetical protein PVL29_019144 [Vitis rotundifolia]|uniref:GDSL esterase/lipase n=1 Tax=Vitis rotundifolia TaxID=103349 RepID=A0AA39DFX2_VITRO|nr:hypothetical protein PVL29_019144 [Vitis rotundifolia]
MDSERVFWIFPLLVLGKIVVVMGGSSSYAFPAVYNFGDSNSDTGGRSAALVQVPPPYGQTFFRKPSGRLSDGRLIIDFIAESLGLPFLSAYLDSIGTNFRHGANFATGGSSIQPGDFSPFHLGVQVSQFIQFKSRTTELYENLSDSGMISSYAAGLPKPGEFSKALYTIDIGQNDLAYAFQNKTEDQVRATIPDIVNQFTQALHQLYDEGARFFWVHNTGPIGCLPLSAIPYQAMNVSLDQYGCIKYQNDIAQELNQQLKDGVTQLKTLLPLATFTYIDIYSAKFSLISDAKNQGFDDPLNYCCGSLFPYPVFCGSTMEVNEKVYGNPCDDPWARISWDGIHYTEAANRWVATKIFSRSLSDPPVTITNACS